MKRLFLISILLLVAAAPAMASVQSENSTTSKSHTRSGEIQPRLQSDSSPDFESSGLISRPPTTMPVDPRSGQIVDDTPAAPVPEPGTMVLTSMGLLALGVAARKRRGS